MMEHDERRGEQRRRTLKRGMIVFNDRYCSTECTIRNESDSGAMLFVDQNQAIPNEIELRLYPNPEYRPAEIVWRTEHALGIHYTDEQKDSKRAWDGVDRRGSNQRRNGERRDM